MNAYISRRPLTFTWLLNLALVPFTPVLLWLVDLKPEGMPLETMQMIAVGLVQVLPTMLLVGVMGWWKELGLDLSASWKGFHLLWFIPVLLIAAVLGMDLPPKTVGVVTSLALLALFVGLHEEIIWRGIVVKVMQPQGTMKAVLWSAFFFGIIHFNSILVGASPAYSLLQVIASFLGGFGLAAIRVRIQSLWPLIIAHGVNNFTMYITREDVIVGTAPPAWLVAAKTLFPLFIFFYGLYLLRNEWLPSRKKEAKVA